MTERGKKRYLASEETEEVDDASFRLCFCTMFLLLVLFFLTSIVFWSVPHTTTVKPSKNLDQQSGKDSAFLFGLTKHIAKTTTSTLSLSSSTTTSPTTLASSKTTEDSVISLINQSASKSNIDQTESIEPSTSEITLTLKANEISSTHLITENVNLSPDFNTPTTDSKEQLTNIYSETSPVNSEVVLSGFVTENDTDKSISLTDSTVDQSPLSGENLLTSVVNSMTTFEFTSEKTETDLSSTLLTISTPLNEQEIENTGSTISLTNIQLSSYDSSTIEKSELTSTQSDSPLNTSDSLTEEKTLSMSTLTSTSFTENLSESNPQLSLSTLESTMDSTTTFVSLSEESRTMEDTKIETTSTSPGSVTCPVAACPVCEVPTCPSLTSSTSTSPPPERRVCRSNQCYVTAGRLLSLVNVSVDPCEDFYTYACGGILNNPTLLENDASDDVWNRIKRAINDISSDSHESHQKLKNYFDGCVQYDQLVSQEERKTQGREIINGVGEFADASSDPENDFTELLIKLFQHGSSPLFDLQLDVDSANSSKFQVVVTLPDWSHSHFLSPRDKSSHCLLKPPVTIPLNLIEAYETYKYCMSNFTEFIDTTQKALEFFGLFDHMSTHNASNLIQEIRMSIELDILELIRSLPTPSTVQKDIQSKTYKLIPKIQLDSEIPQVAWSYLFSTLLNVEVTDATNVQVYFMDYIKSLFAQLQNKNVRTVHNSLLAMFAHDLYTDIVETHHSCDRERYCLTGTAHLMPVVTSNLYLSTFPEHEDRALRKQVILVYQQLVEEMETKLSEATWLDDKTLNEISKKLKFMSIQLPQRFNDSVLSASLDKCSLDSKQYLQDSMCLIRQFKAQLFSRYTLDPHLSQAMWPHFLTSFSDSTAFVYGLNTFMIPFPVLAPTYDKDMPKHVVMAKLGNMLAQGIGRNFDQTGVKFVAGGKIGMMLSEATHPTYAAVVDSSNLQFSWTKSHREHGRVYSYLLDPELTLNERLSDITAANLSLSIALNEEDTELPWVPFTPKQVYFLALSQSFCSKKKIPEVFTNLYEGTHLLAFDRVFNIASNSEQFALAFQCPQGTNMNMHSELKTRPFPLFEKDDLY